MLHRLGYVAIALGSEATTNRTCRLANASSERLRELIGANLTGLAQVLSYNASLGIRLYRISSQIVPFGSHPVNNLPWWEEFKGQLSRLGELIAQSGTRVSMHPGQFTVLSTPDSTTLAASLAEIAWHVRLLDSLHTDHTSKIVVHIGGTYGDKEAAIARFARTVEGLPDAWRRRLVVENDERSYTVEDALRVSLRTGLPVVFDWLHHQINPGRLADPAEAMALCLATWREVDGRPKVHFSSQQPGGRPGAHDDWVNPEEFSAFLLRAPARDFDCMLEAKKKDLALLRLAAELKSMGLWAGPGA